MIRRILLALFICLYCVSNAGSQQSGFASISGRVIKRSDQNPLAGTTIGAIIGGVGKRVIQTVTSLDGVYDLYFDEFDVRYPIQLLALSNGMIYQRIIISLSGGQHLIGIDFELEVGSPVEGRVIDETGNPVPGVEIRVLSERTLPDQLLKIHTDANGRYRCPVALPYNRITFFGFSHPSYQANSIEFITEDSSGIVLPDVILIEGKEVYGKALDLKGNPLHKATIYWDTKPAFTNPGTSNSIFAKTSVETTDDGSYILRDISDSSGWVIAQADGYAPQIAQFQFSYDSNTLLGIDLHLSQGKVISGQIVDERGQPIDRVAVRVLKWRDWRVYMQSELTDANGHFRIEDLPEGKIEIGVRHPEYENESQEIQTSKSVRISLSRKDDGSSAILSGQVISAFSGDPVSYFRAYLRSSTGRYPHRAIPVPHLRHWGSSGHTFRIPNGRFECAGIPVGSEVALTVTAPGYVSKLVQPIRISDSMEPLVISLEPAQEIMGVIQDSYTHTPIEGALIYSFDEDFPLHIMRDENKVCAMRDRKPRLWDFRTRSIYGREVISSQAGTGSFQIRDHAPGTSHIYIEAPGYAPTILKPADISPGAPLAVSLVKGGAIQGHVLTESGSSGVDFTVRLRIHPNSIDSKLRSKNAFKLEYSIRSDERGRFSFENLRAGKYFLSLLYFSEDYGQKYHGEKYGKRISLEVSDGAVMEYDLEAKPNPFGPR